MPFRIWIFSLVVLAVGCNNRLSEDNSRELPTAFSIWDGYRPQTTESFMAKRICTCVEDFLEDAGIQLSADFKVRQAFSLDSELKGIERSSCSMDIQSNPEFHKLNDAVLAKVLEGHCRVKVTPDFLTLVNAMDSLPPSGPDYVLDTNRMMEVIEVVQPSFGEEYPYGEPLE